MLKRACKLSLQERGKKKNQRKKKKSLTNLDFRVLSREAEAKRTIFQSKGFAASRETAQIIWSEGILASTLLTAWTTGMNCSVYASSSFVFLNAVQGSLFSLHHHP